MSEDLAPSDRRTTDGSGPADRFDGPAGPRRAEPGRADPGLIPAQGDRRPGEGPLARADRNMLEMLQELRVAQTGVQILFAFLLSLSFTERFGTLDDEQRAIYLITLLLTTLTMGLLVAPAAVHRMLFGRRVKAAVVRTGQRLFIAGLVALAFTVVGAVLLVLDVVVGRGTAITVTVAVGVGLVALWFVLPLSVLRRAQREEPDDDD